jgi:iron complex outermembrane receptor protein
MSTRNTRFAFRGPLAAAVMLCLALAVFVAVPSGLAQEGPEEEQERTEEEEQPQDSGVVEKVLVTATRAEADTPTTHTNISHETIQQQHTVEEMPALLRIAPSVWSYSDAGNDIGYSYMKIRGFNQQRVSVTINGVPLNSAESHQVFWVDLPNFADSLEDIQVQRGAATGLYGVGAIGGAVNLETERLQPGESWSLEGGFGSYATNKQHVSWKSDLIGERWVFGADLSRIESDGYRNRSWTDMAMGFFTAQRFGEESVTRINVYGGHENTHLAYFGLTREQLREDRRQNPLPPGSEDTFTQPHIDVIHEWKPNERWRVTNTLYAFYGRGYFDQFDGSLSLAALNLAEPGTGQFATDIHRELWIKEWDYGWVPNATWKHGDGELTFGASVRIHRGHQFGEVKSAEGLPAGTPDDFHYYDFRVPKESVTLYGREEWQVTPRVRLLGGLQLTRHSWSLEDSEVLGYSYDVDYDWLAPRVGAHVDLGAGWSGHASISHSRREPSALSLFDPNKGIYDPTVSKVSFRSVNEETGELSDPIPVEEKLTDYELGFEYRSARLHGKLTLYDMQFEDEIVPLGGLNDIGEVITTNAEESSHRGIELEGAARLTSKLDLYGHFTLAEDEHDKFLVPDGAGGTIDLAGNRVAGFPESTGRLALAYKPQWGRVELAARHSGRVYFDNTETENLSVDPYEVLDVSVRYDLPWLSEDQATVKLSVNNLLDEEYETFGYVFFGEPYFIPAAERNVFVTLSFEPGRR